MALSHRLRRLRASDAIQADVDQNTSEPWLEAQLRSESRQVELRLDEGILYCFVCVGGVAKKTVGNPHSPALVPTNDGTVGILGFRESSLGVHRLDDCDRSTVALLEAIVFRRQPVPCVPLLQCATASSPTP